MTERTLVDQRYAAEPRELRRIRSALRRALETVGCDEAATHDLVLAVDEACQNVIRHAYRGAPGGELRVRLSHSRDRIHVSIWDDAPASPSDALCRGRRLEDLAPGGLGTHFMRAVMDEVDLESSPCGRGNRLRMSKRLPVEGDGREGRSKHR